MRLFQVVDSSFGCLIVVWRQAHQQARIVRVLLPNQSAKAYAAAVPGRHARVDALCDQLARFLRGEAVPLPVALLDPAVCTPFQWQVLMAEKEIPRGEVCTYGQLAARVGCPRGARAVGGALARNPFPVIIPCHRTVRGDGALGGYAGGVSMKRRLLEMEGWQFDARGRLLFPALPSGE